MEESMTAKQLIKVLDKMQKDAARLDDAEYALDVSATLGEAIRSRIPNIHVDSDRFIMLTSPSPCSVLIDRTLRGVAWKWTKKQ
jgi:hypothetical protein